MLKSPDYIHVAKVPVMPEGLFLPRLTAIDAQHLLPRVFKFFGVLFKLQHLNKVFGAMKENR
jgi:hypothetical protein